MVVIVKYSTNGCDYKVVSVDHFMSMLLPMNSFCKEEVLQETKILALL